MDNSDVIIAFFAGTLVLFVLVAFGIIFTIIHKKKQQSNKKEKLLLQTKFQQELLQTEVEIQEQTLRYISRELHDNMGQIASLIKINLTTIRLDDPEAATQKIENGKELTRQLIADIKSLSISLNSDRVTSAGLYKALEIEIDRIQKTRHFNASLVVQADPPALDKDRTLMLFRMVQEILNNTLKHSQAKNINCHITHVRNELSLKLRDDGIGFVKDEKLHSGGSGLHNLLHRASLINADLAINSEPGKGTTVTIRLRI
jgi:signal transduction histidine kinase